MKEKIDTLCLVDDDYVFRFLTCKVIEGTSLVKNIQVFSNGLEAINFLKSVRETPEEQPDVILLDLTMPIMDGWGFLDEFTQLKPGLEKKITLYIVSSSIDPDDIERSKKISAVTDFIIKPITREKFLDMIKDLIEEQK